MSRSILPEDRIHPTARDKVAGNHASLVAEVEAAVAKHDLVVVGMAQNPHCKRARKALAAKGVAYEYLEYGSYTSQWRPRTALKMWSGWPTFPMCFHKGALLGGANELIALLDSGELS